MIFVITFRIQTKQKCWLASHLLEMLITLTCWWIYSHNNTDLVFVSRHKEFLNKLAWKQIVDIFSDFTADFFIQFTVKVDMLWWTNFCWSFVLQTFNYSLSASRVPVLQSEQIKGLQPTEPLWRHDANWQLSFCCSKSVWYCQLIFLFSLLFPSN